MLSSLSLPCTALSQAWTILIRIKRAGDLRQFPSDIRYFMPVLMQVGDHGSRPPLD
mgnify:CR=1 FL=1